MPLRARTKIRHELIQRLASRVMEKVLVKVNEYLDNEMSSMDSDVLDEIIMSVLEEDEL